MSRKSGLAEIMKLAVCTVTCTEQEVSLPFASVPVIYTIGDPATAPDAALTVKMLVRFPLPALMLALESEAVTVLPVVESGHTTRAKFTTPVNPLYGRSVIVLVAFGPPIGAVSESGFAERLKLACTETSIEQVAVLVPSEPVTVIVSSSLQVPAPAVIVAVLVRSPDATLTDEGLNETPIAVTVLPLISTTVADRLTVPE
jgi:hypothetical protein